MKIGLKYCAGCRPIKNNIEVFEELVKYLIDKGAFFINANSTCDFLFCLCGCGCRCTSITGCHYTKKVFWVDRSIDRETLEQIKYELASDSID